MDADRFDALARTLSGAATRRRTLAVLLGGFVAPILPGLATEAARGKHHRRGKGKDRGKSKDKSRHPHGQDRPRPERIQAQAGPCWPGIRCVPSKGANVSRCDFADSPAFAGLDCTRCNLSYANLTGADASGATFTRANLSYACLVDANLTDATIASNTNLSYAVLCRTTMPSGNLNNSGCHLGSDCCPACDAAHPCGAGKLCCRGRCITGVCCEGSDCTDQTCKNKDCQNGQCAYTNQTDGAAGTQCASPRQCCNGACCPTDQTCCNGTCCPDGKCCGATCCPDGQKCCGGQCVNEDVCCTNGQQGCGDAQQTCCPGFEFPPGSGIIHDEGVCKQATQQTCGVNDDCCFPSFCCTVGSGKVCRQGSGQPCIGNDDCCNAAGESCGSGGFCCRPNEGDPCTPNVPCYPGLVCNDDFECEEA